MLSPMRLQQSPWRAGENAGQAASSGRPLGLRRGLGSLTTEVPLRRGHGLPGREAFHLPAPRLPGRAGRAACNSLGRASETH